MIDRITAFDRKRNPEATKGKLYKLVSRITRRVLAYGSIEYLKRRERQIQFFKHRENLNS